MMTNITTVRTILVSITVSIFKLFQTVETSLLSFFKIVSFFASNGAKFSCIKMTGNNFEDRRTIKTIYGEIGSIPSGFTYHSFSEHLNFFWSFIKLSVARTAKLFPVKWITLVFSRYITPFKVSGFSRAIRIGTMIGFSKKFLHPAMKSTIANFITTPSVRIFSSFSRIIVARRTTNRTKFISFLLTCLVAVKTLFSNHKLIVADAS